MGVEFKARVFRNGRSRAVRIPAGIDLPGDVLVFRQEGREVTIMPEKPPRTLGELLATWEQLPEDERIGDIDRAPAKPIDL